VQVIPAVDVLGGAVVRLLRGDYQQVTRYGDDPVAVVEKFVSEGAGLVHVVDLGAARSGESDRTLWRRLGAAGVPFQAAGGIRSAADAEAAVVAGAARVVSGTAAVWDPATLRLMADAVGGERLVAAIDILGAKAFGAGWTDAGRPAAEVVASAVAAGAGRLMVTGISSDGALQGPSYDVIGQVAATAGVPVIASGGVARLSDFEGLIPLGVEAVVVGRSLYEGRFTLAEAMAAAG
jgi:phosphoribosylformimino-5-aminoimidazole carboxamide ribotide isomerase